MSIGMIRFPRVDPQLSNGQPTAGSDCSVMTAQGLIRWATWGQKVPSVPAIRAAAGVPTAGLSMAAVLKAYTAFGVSAVLTRSLDDVRNALLAGKAVHAAISYGWVNANQPQLSGDHNFMGGHGLAFYGDELIAGREWVAALDPIADGRRAGIAKQIGMWRLAWVGAAMTAYSSGVQAIVVTKGPRP